MNFKEYWDDLMTKKPIKDGQSVKMSKEQFYNMQKKAFTKGFFACYSQLKEQQKLNPVEKLFNDVDEVIKYLFGKGIKE